MFKISRVTLIITLILIFIIAGVYLLFFPFIHLNYVIYQNKPGTQNSSAVITKFDLFKPKISQVIKLGDGSYWVSVSDFERDGIFTLKDTGFNDGVKKPIDFGAIDAKIENKSFEEVKKLAQDNDLSKVNPDGDNVSNGIAPTDTKSKSLQEAKKPENSYFDVIKIDPKVNYRSFAFEKFYTLRLNITQVEVREQLGDPNISLYPGKSTKSISEMNYLINNNKINFIALGYNEDLLNVTQDGINLNSKLQKIVIVKQDRSFVEVPTKLDGSFDFEVVKNQWE